MAAKLHVAKETFVTEIDGNEVVVYAGVTRVESGHPLLKGREQMFEPAEPRADLKAPRARKRKAKTSKRP